MTFASIRLIEEISMTALPSLQTVYDDGWVLRFADGYTRRANAVNPLYASTQPIDEKIARCEALYHSRGLNAVFKLTSAALPENLDSLLAEQGYTEEPHTSIQLMNLDALDTTDIQPLTLASKLTEEWLSAYCHLNGVAPGRIPLIAQMLSQIVPEAAYASILQNGEIAAVGMGVADRGYIGLFDIVTDARFRQRGLGGQIVTNLLAWGKSCGAQNAYLQVVAANAPARRLYAKIGFQEIYQYWYRVKKLA